MRWTRRGASISITSVSARAEAPARGHAMTDQSMRGFLASLEQSGDLQRVERQVDPRFELGVVLSLLDRGPAVRFERVGSSTMPVVGNILTSRERFARALGIERARAGRSLSEGAAIGRSIRRWSQTRRCRSGRARRRRSTSPTCCRCPPGSSARPRPTSRPASSSPRTRRPAGATSRSRGCGSRAAHG